MKRKTLFVLAVLVVAFACLFTSCSGSVEPPRAEEEFGYVTFGNGSSRTLSTEYGIKSYDDLNWFYTSHKMDSYGLTGETSTEKPVPAKSNGKGIGSGAVGPFSQGAWQFTLYAYETTETTRTLVYKGTSSTVILKGGETKAVPVSVSLQGDNGLINVSQAYFEWANGSDASGKIYVTIELASNTSTGSPYFFGPLTRSSDKYTFGTISDSFTVPADYYTCTVNAYMLEDVIVPEEGDKTVKSDATPLATQTFGLRVYGNATTYIKGNLTEGLFAEVVFKVAEQDMKVFVPNANGSATINNISVTPSGVTGKTTSVTFSEGALSDVDDAQLQLDVNVTPIEYANEKFNIVGVDTNNKSAFAGIDIALMQTTSDGNSTPVESFNNNASTTATVTTYIATGLSNVVVKYAGNPNEVITSTYNPADGCLTFITSHFSEYYVLADCVVLNLKRNIGYSSLEDAVSGAETNDTIKMMADYVIPQSTGTIRISDDKNLILDLNGRTLSSSIRVDNADKHYYAIDNYGSLTIEDSSSEQKGTISARGVENLGNGVLVINSGNLYSIDSNGGASIWNEASLVVNGGSFHTEYVGSASDSVGIGCLNNSGSALITGGYFEGVNKRTYAIISTGEIVIKPGEGKSVTVNGAHGGLAIDSGTGVVYGGEYSSTDYYGLYVSNDGTGSEPKIAMVTVYGGVFNGKDYSVWIGSDYNNPVNSTIEILGGTFGKPLNAQECTREGAIKIKGGIYASNPSSYVDAYAVSTENSDGTFSVITLPVDTEGSYLINDVDELLLFAKLVNVKGCNFSGKTVKLAANIDLSGIEWTPIGTNADGANKFQGTFDGQGHTISNMTVDQDDAVKYRAAGFFGALNGTAKNIIFDNATVTSISAPNAVGWTDNGTAVVAGSIYTSGSIEGVTVKNSRVSGNRYVGGVSGYTYGSVKNCTVENTTVTSTPDNLTGSYDNGDKAGGVVGAFWHENTHEISGNTVNNVTVKGYRDIGGIVGYANGSVRDNTVNGLTLIQDYSVLTDPKTTVEAVIGRHDGFVVDASNTATDGTINKVFYVSSNDGLSSALTNTADSIFIQLAEGSFTLTSGSCQNKNVKLVGSGEGTVLSILPTNAMAYQNGATLVFENMTIQAQTSGTYGGLAHTNKVTYNNCTILGKITLYSDTEFNNCTFENKNDYAIWTWGGKVVNLTGCTFNSGGKAVLLYGGAGSPETPTTVLTVTDCVFNDDGTLATDKKAAIETGNDYGATYILNVNKATVNGFDVNPNGKSTRTKLWANKNSMNADHLFVTVDGVKVYGN